MTILLSTILTRVAIDLNETSNAFLSGAWTQTEMIGYINHAERDFLLRTGIWKTDSSIVASAGASILFNRPANTMDIDRVGFNGKRLYRQSSQNLELEDRDWRTYSTGNPSYWHEDNLANSQFEINKIPAAGGTLRLFADYLPNAYTVITDAFHLAASWEPYVRWKTISLSLAKKCEDQDLGRSNYAQQRYMVGVQLARHLMMGSMTGNLKG
jgi:hypothetical protein